MRELPILKRDEASDQNLLSAFAQAGAVLLRQGRANLDAFLQLSARLGRNFGGEASGPHLAHGGNLGRTAVAGHASLFHATGKSLRASLPLHGELYFQNRPPDLLWFYCAQASPEASATWLCDGHQLFDALPPAIQQLLSSQQIVYTRHLTAGFWQQSYGCEEFADLKSYLQAQGITAKQEADGGVSTHFVTSALRQYQHQTVFINNLLPFALREIEDPHGTRARVRLENGTRLPDQTVFTIQQTGDQLKYALSWLPGDILLIDNRRILHGRGLLSPGPRELYLRMSEAACEP